MQYKPKVGTVLWSVKENYYYRPTSAAPFREYVVRKAIVTGYYKGGYTEIRTREEPCSDFDKIGIKPCYYKLSMLDNEYIFSDKRDAALFAKDLSDKEDERDRSIATIIHRPFEPIRRTWETFLIQGGTEQWEF